jgi:predicted dehydrogenase
VEVKMAKTYGVGIMGAGNISAAYLRLAPLFKGLEVRAIADILPEAAKKRADEFDVRAQTPDELLKNSEIDVVVNLTIPSTHFRVSMDAISAGKHAYSEKPFVLTLEEGKRLKQAAGERKLSVGSAPDTFLGSAHQQVRNLIDTGKLGRITSGTTHVMSRGMEHWHPNPDFFFQPGAGPILDIGPYYVTDQTGTKQKVAPWDHPFGKINQGADTPMPRANYRTAGLADMIQAIEKKRPARAGLDVALHAVDVMTSLLKAGETGKVITLTTTCERPRALKPKDALALLK